MRFRSRFKGFKRPSFGRVRRFGSSIGRGFKRIRSRKYTRKQKILGMSTTTLLIVGVASYFFVKPVKEFVDKILKK